MLQLLQVKGWLDNRNLSARERKKVGGPACTCLPLCNVRCEGIDMNRAPESVIIRPTDM